MDIRILAIGLLAGSALVESCSDEQLIMTANSEDKTQLHIEVTSQPDVKGVVPGSQLPDRATVGLRVVDDSGSQYDDEIYENIPYQASGSVDQTWTNADQMVILSKTSGTVYAYYPYNESVASLEEIPVDATTGADYLYADPFSGVCFNAPNASLVMHHAMACIRVKVVSAGYDGPGEVSAISLMGTGYGTRATLNAKTGQLSGVEGTGEEVTDHTGWNLNGSVEGHLLVAPNGETGNLILVVHVDGITFRVITDPTLLESGKIYEYTLQLSDNYMMPLTISQVGVTDWTIINATSEEGYQRHLLWNIAENGVYAVTSKGYLVYESEADASCVAAAVIHHGVKKYLMIEKNESNNQSYKKSAAGKTLSYAFLYGNVGEDIQGLSNRTYVIDNTTYVFYKGTDTPQLTKDPALWTNGGLADWNGASNTEKLLDLTPPDSYRNYQTAGELLKDFRKSDDALGYSDWYIPSCGEWGLIALYMDEVNAVLAKIGGHQLMPNQNYLASTESSKDYKFFVGTNYIGRSVKQTVGRIRFVRPLDASLTQAE